MNCQTDGSGIKIRELESSDLVNGIIYPASDYSFVVDLFHGLWQSLIQSGFFYHLPAFQAHPCSIPSLFIYVSDAH